MPRYIDADLIEYKAICVPMLDGVLVRTKQLDGFYAIKKDIEAIPTADVQKVRRGVWLPILESEITGWNPEFAGRDPVGGYICSICKNEAIYSCNDEWVLSDFCPYCGAKMDGGKSDE